MHESKHFRLLTEEKHTRSSHALIDRSLLKNMQVDINHASELIVTLRGEKENLKQALLRLQQENHEKNNTIRSLRKQIKCMESMEEDDDVVKELSQANLKLKNEIELSMNGTTQKTTEITSKIISLTETFLTKTHDKTKHYKVFKNVMKNSNSFKQVIGHEKWAQATFLLLSFYKELFTEDEPKVKIIENIAEESEQESYSNLIQESKNLLDTLSYQKNKLENLNREFSSRGTKSSPNGSPIYRGNLTAEKIGLSPDRKETAHLVNFHTANRISNLAKYKQQLRKNK